MFTKILIVVPLVLVLTLGCARENEPGSPPIVPKLKTSGGCISSFGDQLKLFADGNMSANQVSDFWNCLSSAVDEYQNLTAGESEPDKYTPQALRRFLQTYFIKDHAISNSLLDSIMELKRVFLAGTSKEVTRAELTRAREFIGELREASLTLRPHVKVLFHKQNQASDAEIRAASTAMEAAFQRLGGWLNQRQQTYSFMQLANFMGALKQWLREGGNTSTSLDTIERVLTILPDSKLILVGGSKQGIELGEWSALTNTIGKLFRVYLASSYGFKENFDAGFNRPVLPEGFLALCDLFEQGIAGHKTENIPLVEFRNLFVSIENAKLLPTNFTAPAMSKMFLWLLQRVIGGTDTKLGLDRESVAHVRLRLENWITLFNSNLSPTSQAPIVTDFHKMLAETPGMEWDSEGRLIFRLHPPTAWTEQNSRHMMWGYILLGWMKDAYGDPKLNYIVQEQMDVAVGEVLPLLQNFGWLPETKMTISKRRFREADLFTLGANGDNHLDLGEAVRYLGFIMGAYRSADVWLTSADTACGGREVSCVRPLALNPTIEILTPMARFETVLKTWGSKRFFKYMKNAEKAILTHEARGVYAMGDLLQVMQLFEYAETFIQRFDADDSESISLNEAMTAFELYGPALGRLLPHKAGTEIPRQDVLDFYTFMMNFGDTPYTMFGGQIAFLNWKMHRDNWRFESERDVLMAILAQMSTM